jgi:hypothetical protein
MSFTTAALLATWIAIILVALALAGVERQVRMLVFQEVRGRSLGIPPGAPAPAVDGLDFLAAPTLLLFTSPDCDVCSRVLARAAEVARSSKHGSLRLAAVFPDAKAENTDGLESIESTGAFERFAVPATPFAVLVGKDGRIRATAPVGSEQSLQQFISTFDEGGVDVVATE